jgi:hypothetical protein
MKMKSNELEIQPTFIRKQEGKGPVRSPCWLGIFPLFKMTTPPCLETRKTDLHRCDNLKTERSAN